MTCLILRMSVPDCETKEMSTHQIDKQKQIVLHLVDRVVLEECPNFSCDFPINEKIDLENPRTMKIRPIKRFAETGTQS